MLWKCRYEALGSLRGLGGTRGTLTDLAPLVEEQEWNGTNDNTDERKKQAGPRKRLVEVGLVEVVVELRDLEKSAGCCHIRNPQLTQSGTVAPIHERINVFAATADAA